VFPVIVIATFIIGFAHAIFYHAYILNNKGKLYFLTIVSVFLLNFVLNIISNLMGHPFFSSWIAIGTSILYALITYFYASKMHRFYFPKLFFIKVLFLSFPIFLMYFYNPIINTFYLIAFKAVFAAVFYVGAVFVFNVFDGRAKIYKAFNGLKYDFKKKL
jgi:O-antigen/teichoic acid export membrane protein